MQVPDMIKVHRSAKKNRWLTLIIMLIPSLPVGLVTFSHAVEKEDIVFSNRTIVIDPGHGGHDQGAQGPDGSLEKEIALSLAQILAKELKPDYQVELTRNGDYQVTLTRRASVANHHQADLFIGIHTGGGSRYQMDAWSVFYYEASESPEKIRPDKNSGNKARNLPFHWDQVCLFHQKESRTLAECIKTQLADNPESREVTVSKAALRVLHGLDMPAIVIETGYLTNPKTEKRLNATDFLTDIAKRIKTGVDVYLTR
jgi:N-acetylmuramoyl-L-alanine amidase